MNRAIPQEGGGGVDPTAGEEGVVQVGPPPPPAHVDPPFASVPKGEYKSSNYS